MLIWFTLLAKEIDCKIMINSGSCCLALKAIAGLLAIKVALLPLIRQSFKVLRVSGSFGASCTLISL